QAEPERVRKEIEDIIGIDATDAVMASGKTGLGVLDILEKIVKQVPAPNGDENEPLQALIFDSYFDQYRGVIPTVRVVNGSLKKGDIIEFMASKGQFEVVEVGVYTPLQKPVDILGPGDVGYVVASINTIGDVRVGDTITKVEIG